MKEEEIKRIHHNNIDDDKNNTQNKLDNKLLYYKEILERPHKGISIYMLFFIIFLGIGLGIYYWTVNDFLFTYQKISPFLGFVCFSLSGLLLSFILLVISNKRYKLYNKKYGKVKEEIESRIENKDGSSEELFFMKKILIEYKINNLECTKKDYVWYSFFYCVGCGKKKNNPYTDFSNYVYNVEKKETWREGPFRHYQKFKKSFNIPLCKECYKKMTDNKDIINYNKKLENIVKFFVYLLFFIYTIIFGYGDMVGEISFKVILYSFFTTLLLFGVLNFTPIGLLFEIVLFILLKPFKKKEKYKTFIDFDNIPFVREFYDNYNHKK